MKIKFCCWYTCRTAQELLLFICLRSYFAICKNDCILMHEQVNQLFWQSVWLATLSKMLQLISNLYLYDKYLCSFDCHIFLGCCSNNLWKHFWHGNAMNRVYYLAPKSMFIEIPYHLLSVVTECNKNLSFIQY